MGSILGSPHLGQLPLIGNDVMRQLDVRHLCGQVHPLRIGYLGARFQVKRFVGGDLGNNGKKKETTIMGYIGTTIRNILRLYREPRILCRAVLRILGLCW